MSADEPRDEGNKAFDAGDYDQAIDLFTQAIALHPNDHVLFASRSAAYAGKNQWAEAQMDAEQCIALNPSRWEGFARKGAALHGAGRYAEAVAAYEEGLKLEDRPALRKGLKEVQDAKATDDGKMFSDPLFCKLDSNPRTQKHLSDPEDVPPAYEDQLRDKLAETDPAVAKELAYSLNRLGVDASTIGRNEDGPPAYEQAGQDRRKLTDTDPTAAKELANSLNRLGIDLSAIGRHGDSLRIDEEAVELPRKFVTVEMDPTITKDLANSLDRLGVNMSVLGSNEDASCTAREAGEIHGNNDSSRSSPESEHAGVGSMKTGSFVYSADADNPETAVDSFATNDLDCVQANLNGGGYSMSVHEPTEAASWMEDNWDKPLLNSIRTSGCGGPFAWMLSPTKPALAIFGSHNEPIVVNMAQSLAEASGFPVVIRPDSDNPALTLLARDSDPHNEYVPFNNNAGGNSDERGRDVPRSILMHTIRARDNDPHNEYVPFNNNAGGNSDERGRDADDEGEGIIEEEHIPGEPGNGGRTDADLDDAEPIENGWEMVDHEPNRNCCAQAPGGGDGGGGGGATMVDYNWESPLHSTKVNLRLKLDTARTYGVTIGYTFKFMINRDAEKPTDRDNLTLPVSQPEVTALVDFKIETVPRESQIDRSYASIGFVVDRSKSISYREFLYKHGQQKQIQQGTQGTLGWSHAGIGTLSLNRNKTTTVEATDDKVMPKCSVYAEPGEEWNRPNESYSSYNIAYQPQDIQLEAERSDVDPLEFKVGMGINLRPPGLEQPLPRISFINRSQVLIWVSDPKSKTPIRGIMVLLSSYFDNIRTEERRCIYEREEIELGSGSLPKTKTDEYEPGTISLSIAQVQKQSASVSNKLRTVASSLFAKIQRPSVSPRVEIPTHEYLARGWDANNSEWRKGLWPALDKDFRAAAQEGTAPVWNIQLPWTDAPRTGPGRISDTLSLGHAVDHHMDKPAAQQAKMDVTVTEDLQPEHSSRTSSDLDDTGVGSAKAGTFVIYSPADDSPETPADSFTTNDLTYVQANLGIGGCLMSIHDSAEAASWIEDNWDGHLLTSIRNSGCGGPFAWMLSPTKPALAIFGHYSEPIVVNMAQTLAQFSRFPVIVRAAGDNPALTLLAHDANHQNGHVHFDNNTGGNNEEKGRDVDEGDEIIEEERIPGEPGNGGRRDADLNGAEPIENGLERVDHEPNRNGGAPALAGGDGGGGGGEPTTVNDQWDSPIHSTSVKLRLKLDKDRSRAVTIGYTLQFTVIRDTKPPVDLKNMNRSLSQPEVIAQLDFKIESIPRETQVDRSYASIGFVAHRKMSISRRDFLDRGFEPPGRIWKQGQQRQVQKGAQGTFGWSHLGPVGTATLSGNENKTTIREATDDKAMPKCSIHAEPGDDPDDDQKSYSSYNFAYQLQDMQLDSEQSVGPGMEFKVGMGINIRPPGSKTPHPQISFINRNQILIWVTDPAFKAGIRGIVVLMSSYLDNIREEEALSIMEKAEIELGTNHCVPRGRLQPSAQPVDPCRSDADPGKHAMPTSDDRIDRTCIPGSASDLQGSTRVSQAVQTAPRNAVNASQTTQEPGIISLSIAQVEKQSASGSNKLPAVTSIFKKLQQPGPEISPHEYLARGWNDSNKEWTKVLWPALDKDFRAAKVEGTKPVWEIQRQWRKA